MIDRRLFTHIDWVIISITAALAVIGLATVYSATHAKWPVFYQKEIYWILIGAGAMLAAVIINYSFLERVAYILYGASLALLAAVPIIGRGAGGAKRWIGLGAFSLQPSELAKLALILALAKYFSSRQTPQKGLDLRDLAVPAVFLVLPFLFIAKQPDLGTALVLCLIFAGIAVIVKIRTRVLVGFTLVMLAVMPLAWKMLKGYQKARLTSFLDPAADPRGTGYHLMQSKIAIGSGGFFGKGFTNGTQGKLMFLPEHHTDFIFAVFAEEWGLAGSLVLITLLGGLIVAGINTAATAKDRFGFLLAFGVSALFFWHAAVNLGMVCGLLPVVGVPLPFISYGGSFMLTCMIGAGLLINVKMRRFMF